MPTHNAITRYKAKLSLLASKLGLPLPKLMDSVRLAIGFNCNYCSFYAEVMRKGLALGEQHMLEILEQIIIAKNSNDEALLARLKEEFNNGTRRSNRA